MKKIIFILFCTFYLFLSHDASSQEIKNPVFPGDHPDPSILKDGKDYYVVHSSFEYYPGLTIWHSTNLVDWEPVTSALTKYIGSVWAPDLIKYKGDYYIYFPSEGSNYVIKAESIEGPWSDPVDLNIGFIDPGHITDDQGNRYLYFSSGDFVPLSEDGLSVTGEPKHVYDGWPIPEDWSIECFCLEGPKLFKHGDYYYLTVAEGGTAGPPTGHMVVSARSKSPLGPWENSPQNPILRAQGSDEPWHSVGHGTIFEGQNNQWWIIFHGYEKHHQNMGRQSLILPIKWTEDGWFKIPEKSLKNFRKSLEHPKPKQTTYDLSDNFEGEDLKDQWKFFGAYEPDRYELTGSGLLLKAEGSSSTESTPLLVTPRDHSYRTDIEVELNGNAKVGLLMFYNMDKFSGILSNGNDIYAKLKNWQFPTEEHVVNKHFFLRLENRNNIIDMFYSKDGQNWHKISNSLSVSSFQHNVLGGFLSLKIGITAYGDGSVLIKDFNYKPLKIKK